MATSRNRIRRWLRRHRLYTGRITHVRHFEEGEELPEPPGPDELAVVGPPDRPSYAVLDCPCGRGHTVRLPLSLGGAPGFQLDERGEAPTIVPAVRRSNEDGDACHFWVCDGSFYWI